MEEDKQKYILEKNVWTHDDIEVMGWHDAHIYGFIIEKPEVQFSGNLLFDIDYIFEWVHPVEPEKYFSFWVAPCTLLFEEVFDLKINLDTNGYITDILEVADLCLVNKNEIETNRFEYQWGIELQQGHISFKSYSMQQIVRKYPIFTNGQTLDIDVREGISFSKQPINL